MGKKRRLLDEYRFPGFRPRSEVQGIFGDPRARIIRLERTQKKQHAAVAEPFIGVITTKQHDVYGICPVEMRGYTWKWKSGESGANSAEK
jgi:hypothetical protein